MKTTLEHEQDARILELERALAYEKALSAAALRRAAISDEACRRAYQMAAKMSVNMPRERSTTKETE